MGGEKSKPVEEKPKPSIAKLVKEKPEKATTQPSV